MKNIRVIISLDLDDTDDLLHAIQTQDTTGIWYLRLKRAHDHLNDDVTVHYTDLGADA